MHSKLYTQSSQLNYEQKYIQIAHLLVSDFMVDCRHSLSFWLSAIPARRICKGVFTDSGITDRSVSSTREYLATKDNETASNDLTLNAELQAISRCESGGKQFKPDGTVLRGRINPQDIGMFQINEKYWLAKSLALGYNIYTEKGNIEMAKWIYERYGNAPWVWSKKCWSGN